MRSQIYLIATRDGVSRLTKRLPDLARNEIAVRLNVTIPDACFRSPIITGELSVAEDQVIQPVIEVELLNPSAPEETRRGRQLQL